MPRINPPTPEAKNRDAELHKKYITEHPLTEEQRSRKLEQERVRYHKDVYKSRKIITARKRIRKQEALDLLGSYCMACGNSYSNTFDHINGNGTKERKSGESSNIVSKILAGRTEDMRVLCFSCNHLARKDVFGPNINIWPTEVLNDLSDLKKWWAERRKQNEDLRSTNKETFSCQEKIIQH